MKTKTVKGLAYSYKSMSTCPVEKEARVVVEIQTQDFDKEIAEAISSGHRVKITLEWEVPTVFERLDELMFSWREGMKERIPCSCKLEPDTLIVGATVALALIKEDPTRISLGANGKRTVKFPSLSLWLTVVDASKADEMRLCYTGDF